MDKKDRAKRLREQVTLLERKLGMLEDEIVDCCGLTMAQCHAVVELGTGEPASLNDLARSLNLENSTVSRTVNNLVNGEIAVRAESAEDRRYVNISLTEKGKDIFENIETNMESFFDNIIRRIPDEKHDQVIESLKVLLDAISEEKCCR
ncbi:MAG: MarR family transcriptional regulator [Denitrovibrio sp.]|nr:MAG: MarR family transcriptional regulator [Denitrovibrio sp.]